MPFDCSSLRLFRKALLERFFHFLGAEFPDDPDAAVVDVRHLITFPVKVFRGVHHDPVNEFVDQFRRQLLDLGELLYLADEPLIVPQYIGDAKTITSAQR